MYIIIQKERPSWFCIYNTDYVAIYRSNCVFIPNMCTRHEVASRYQSSSLALKKYVRQLLKHKNFWWFTAMNLIQVSARAIKCTQPLGITMFRSSYTVSNQADSKTKFQMSVIIIISCGQCPPFSGCCLLILGKVATSWRIRTMRVNQLEDKNYACLKTDFHSGK